MSDPFDAFCLYTTGRTTAEVMDEVKIERWMICDAPAGGCGAGPRRAILRELNVRGEAYCQMCGCQMRRAKRAPKGSVRS